MKLEQLEAYTVVDKRKLEDIHSMGYLLRHNKTGARITLISNDDVNKVFYIGFRTPPKDSTGVAHIVEHTVLCGSDKFPVKDPFIELAKGSLNTFLNAMTYPDKTVYPVASYNDRDFQNLMDVYLDAVFHPNIYREEKIFQQEGWHYELENAEDELTINGVVYSEMKGAFSSPEDVLEQQILSSLYPDTAYAVVSGGDPEVIPQLTYEDFLAFHRRYYHPSNSYIYLYGDMDMAQKLQWIDEEYLSKYEALAVDSEIAVQKPFAGTMTAEAEYSVSESESEEDNTYLSYNIAFGVQPDQKFQQAMDTLAQVLCMVPGAPVKQALLDAGIGTEIDCGYEALLKQPQISIIAKNTNASRKDEFVEVIEGELRRLVREGLDRKALAANLNNSEFRYREADYGSYPKGLMYGLNLLQTWLYDDNRPFVNVELLETFRALRQEVDTGYFEELIREHLLANPHKSVVIVKPVRGLTGQKERQLAGRLADRKAAMDAGQIDRIIRQTEALKAYQEQDDEKEALEKIPLLSREDLKKEAEPFRNEIMRIGDTVLLYHDVYTNGIGYLRFVFDLRQVPQELLPYVGVLKAVIGLVSTESYSYSDLYSEINLYTGGISPAVNSYADMQDLSQYTFTFDLKIKTLYENLPKAFALAAEILTKADYTDEKRLHELIAEARSAMQADMTVSGHRLAAERALSYLHMRALLGETMQGIPLYRLLEDLEEHFEEKKGELTANLRRIAACIFRPENLLVDYTAEREGLAGVEELAARLKEALFTEPVGTPVYTMTPEKKNEGFMTSAQIQYVCRAGSYLDKGLAYHGALKVLRVMMGYEYLWTQVRVKGGAYGCMCSFGEAGDCYFVSYRDPHLAGTVEVYEQAADYIERFEADERTMTQYVIGAVGETDMPKTPAMKGAYSLSGYMSHRTYEQVQKSRDEMLSADAGAIRSLAAYVRAFVGDGCLCVVGNEEKIKANDGMFGRTDYLFH